MIAIRLTISNLHRILNESPIDRRDLEAMIEEYDTPHRENALFFVPQHELAHEMDRHSWMTVPKETLAAVYSYDDTKIDTQFVEITRK